MESNAGAPFSDGLQGVVFMPAELPPELLPPEPTTAGGSHVGTHAIRRKVLTGVDESGQPVDFGDATYALIDIGMRDGCTGLACSTNGLIAVYTSHNERSRDLSKVSPEIVATAKDFIDSLVAVAQGMQPDQAPGWPMPRHARFWLRTNGRVTGITGTAENLAQPMLPWTRSFKLAERIIMAAEPPAQTSNPTTPTAPAAKARAVELRRNALLGTNEHAQPVAPGAGIAALAEFGIPGGCVTVAAFHNGEVSLILYHMGAGLDLGLNPSSPLIASAVRRLVGGTSALGEQFAWSDRIDYPIAGEARIYRPTPQGIRCTSVPSLAVHDPRIGAADVFAAAMSLIENFPRALEAVLAQFPAPAAR